MTEDKLVLEHAFTPRSMPTTLAEKNPRFQVARNTWCLITRRSDRITPSRLTYRESVTTFDVGFSDCVEHRNGWRYFQQGEWCLKVREDQVKCRFSNDEAKTKWKPKKA